MRISPRALGVLAAVLTVAIWTGFIIIGRASAARTLTPFDIGLLRILGASLVLLPWGLYLTRRASTAKGSSSLWGLSPLPWRQTVMVGFVGGPLYAVLCYAGFVYAPAAHASVLMPGSLPLWTAILAFLLLGERFTRLRLVGLACIVAGDLLVGGASLLRAFQGGEVWKGDLIFMSAALCWGIYSILARQFKLDAVRGTIAITAFAFCTYVPVFFLLTQLGGLTSHLSTVAWSEIVFHMVFQGGGSVVLAGIAFTYMVKQFGPVRSTMITALVPGLSALGAVFFLGEPLGLNLLVGLALVTIGIMFGVSASSKAAGQQVGTPANAIAKGAAP